MLPFYRIGSTGSIVQHTMWTIAQYNVRVGRDLELVVYVAARDWKRFLSPDVIKFSRLKELGFKVFFHKIVVSLIIVPVHESSEEKTLIIPTFSHILLKNIQCTMYFIPYLCGLKKNNSKGMNLQMFNLLKLNNDFPNKKVEKFKGHRR